MINFENPVLKKEKIHGADEAIFKEIKKLIDLKSDFKIFKEDNSIDFERIGVDLIATFESCQYPALNNIAYELEKYIDSAENEEKKFLNDNEKEIFLQEIYRIILNGFSQIQN